MADPTVARRPRRRLSPDRRRAELLVAAQRAFASRSYAEVTLESISDDAGASTGLIAFHFGGKRGLYLECLRAATQELLERHRRLEGAPSAERLAASVRVHVAYATERRPAYLALLRGGEEAGFPEAAELLEGVRRQLVERLLAGLGRRPTPALMVALRGYLSYVDAITVAWLSLSEEERGQVPCELLAELAVAAFRGTIAALGNGRRPRKPPAPAPDEVVS
jgi:AcrR family transcriptional regulator